MAIEFDPAKDAANIEKHGISLADAQAVLFDPLALTVEDLGAVGERRYVTIGVGAAGNPLVVVYTQRGGRYRLISARRATRKERKTYEA